MDISSIGRLLITFGVVVLVLGVVLVLAGKVPLFGRLPGDFVFHRDGFTLFAPITTMIIVSLVLTILVNLFIRFFR
jgi:ribose/xylose/arabinose/galactoside ABC-type transport system permease subunit